jgi:curved DNA-binding protein CbpA
MLIHYITLGLTPEASDEQIRSNYLELVKRYPPEKNPDRFRQVNAAYEAVRDIRKRLEGLYLVPDKLPEAEDALHNLIQIASATRRRVGLQELLNLRIHRT